MGLVSFVKKNIVDPGAAKIKEVKGNVDKTLNAAKDKVVKTTKDTFEKGVDTAKEVKKTVEKKVDEVTKSVGDAVQATGEVVARTVRSGVETAQNIGNGAVQLVGDVLAGRNNPALTQAIDNVQKTLLSAVGEENVQKVIDGKFSILSPLIHRGEQLADMGLNALGSVLKATGLAQKLPFDVDNLNTAAIGAALLNMDKIKDSDGNDIYSANKDCWQRSVGYNDLWDFGFALGTSMQRDKFEFEHDGEKVMLWAWKGDYINLGAGAELGIYTQSKEGSDHWISTEDHELDMQMTLKDKDGKTIINYNPTDTQWWITGFNPAEKGVKAADLTAEYTVGFSSKPEMYESFKKEWENKEGPGGGHWVFDDSTKSATLTF
ncbi:MAG: DUF4474 domain-containing protein [Cystobacterineae bacterium]|nr:DUF4474 domain-containing protein [Cystobacterineae bacterium]